MINIYLLHSTVSSAKVIFSHCCITTVSGMLQQASNKYLVEWMNNRSNQKWQNVSLKFQNFYFHLNVGENINWLLASIQFKWNSILPVGNNSSNTKLIDCFKKDHWKLCSLFWIVHAEVAVQDFIFFFFLSSYYVLFLRL